MFLSLQLYSLNSVDNGVQSLDSRSNWIHALVQNTVIGWTFNVYQPTAGYSDISSGYSQSLHRGSMET